MNRCNVLVLFNFHFFKMALTKQSHVATFGLCMRLLLCHCIFKEVTLIVVCYVSNMKMQAHSENGMLQLGCSISLNSSSFGLLSKSFFSSPKLQDMIVLCSLAFCQHKNYVTFGVLSVSTGHLLYLGKYQNVMAVLVLFT